MRNNNEIGGTAAAGSSVTPRKEENEVSSVNRSIFINQEHETGSKEVKEILLKR